MFADPVIIYHERQLVGSFTCGKHVINHLANREAITQAHVTEALFAMVVAMGGQPRSTAAVAELGLADIAPKMVRLPDTGNVPGVVVENAAQFENLAVGVVQRLIQTTPNLYLSDEALNTAMHTGTVPNVEMLFEDNVAGFLIQSSNHFFVIVVRPTRKIYRLDSCFKQPSKIKKATANKLIHNKENKFVVTVFVADPATLKGGGIAEPIVNDVDTGGLQAMTIEKPTDPHIMNATQRIVDDTEPTMTIDDLNAAYSSLFASAPAPFEMIPLAHRLEEFSAWLVNTQSTATFYTGSLSLPTMPTGLRSTKKASDTTANVKGFTIHLSAEPAEGHIERLYRPDQLEPSTSRRGRTKVNLAITGIYAVKIMARRSDSHDSLGHTIDNENPVTCNLPGPPIELHPRSSTSPNRLVIQGVTLEDIEAFGNSVRWIDAEADREFPIAGVITVKDDLLYGTVYYKDRTETWLGFRSEFIGKSGKMGNFSHGLDTVTTEDEMISMPFPLVNTVFSSTADDAGTDPLEINGGRQVTARSSPFISSAKGTPPGQRAIDHVFTTAGIDKLTKQRDRLMASYQKAKELHQGTPLDMSQPETKKDLALPPIVTFGPGDFQPRVAGLHLDLSQLDIAGNGDILEVRVGDPVNLLVNATQIQEDASLIGFKDEEATRQMTTVGLIDTSKKWRQTIVADDGRTAYAPRISAISPNHNDFYRHIPQAVEGIEKDTASGKYSASSPWPPRVPFDIPPNNIVPKGDKYRRVTNQSSPLEPIVLDEQRQSKPVLALESYNSQITKHNGSKSQPKLRMPTKQHIGHAVCVLMSTGRQVLLHVADVEDFFRMWTVTAHRQGLTILLDDSGFRLHPSACMGPGDVPLITSRFGSYLVELTAHHMQLAVDNLNLDSSTQQWLDHRSALLGSEQAKLFWQCIFVDDMLNVVIDQLSEASSDWLQNGIEKHTGLRMPTKKLQTIGEVADYCGLTYRIARSISQSGVRLMDEKVDRYIAFIKSLIKQKWVSENEIDQLLGRLIHSATVYGEIFELMEDVYAARYTTTRRRDGKKPLSKATPALEAIVRIIDTRELRPLFPSLQLGVVGSSDTVTVFTDASKPGDDGRIPGTWYGGGIWVFHPLIGTRDLQIEFTPQECLLPVSVLEFITILWGFQAIWPLMVAAGAERAGVIHYLGATDSESTFQKQQNRKPRESAMELVHRHWARDTRVSSAISASIQFWPREHNELADCLTHGPKARPAFQRLLAFEGFPPSAPMDLSNVNRSTNYLTKRSSTRNPTAPSTHGRAFSRCVSVLASCIRL